MVCEFITVALETINEIVHVEVIDSFLLWSKAKEKCDFFVSKPNVTAAGIKIIGDRSYVRGFLF